MVETFRKVDLQQFRSLTSPQRCSALAGGVSLNGDRLKRSAQSGVGLSRDRGGNRLQTASSLRRYLQGLARPGTNRSLRDATGRTDPDYYRLFDEDSQPLAFQGSGSLMIACNLVNRSTAPIVITQLSRQGTRIPGSRATLQPGESFNYPDILSRGTFYLKVTSNALGQNRYELNLPIINS